MGQQRDKPANKFIIPNERTSSCMIIGKSTSGPVRIINITSVVHTVAIIVGANYVNYNSRHLYYFIHLGVFSFFRRRSNNSLSYFSLCNKLHALNVSALSCLYAATINDKQLKVIK